MLFFPAIVILDLIRFKRMHADRQTKVVQKKDGILGARKRVVVVFWEDYLSVLLRVLAVMKVSLLSHNWLLLSYAVYFPPPHFLPKPARFSFAKNFVPFVTNR